MLTDVEIDQIALTKMERRLKTPASVNVFEESLVSQGLKALKSSGLEINDVLEKYPGIDYRALASCIGGGASSLALKRIAYKRFFDDRDVISFVKDLLTRHILKSFPAGWPLGKPQDIHFEFSPWLADIADLTTEVSPIVASLKISRHFCFIEPPAQSWRPLAQHDERVDSTIEKYWPRELGSGLRTSG